MISATRVIGLIGLVTLTASLSLSEREDLVLWSPIITDPTAGKLVCVGTHLDVNWYYPVLPPVDEQRERGTFYYAQNGVRDMDNPAASDVLLGDKHVNFLVPTSRLPGTYQLVFVYYDESWSESFKIGYCARH